MSDIAARGRERATAYIVELKAENARLRAVNERLTERGMEVNAWCKQLQVDIERLRASNAELLVSLKRLLVDYKEVVSSLDYDEIAIVDQEAMANARAGIAKAEEK